GIARYENDYYHQQSQDLANVPGNPWFICTLWLAQWAIATARTKADLKPAVALFEWCVHHGLPSGVLAEQVHPYTHAPLSVSPLTWSHATFVMAVQEYLAQWRARPGPAYPETSIRSPRPSFSHSAALPSFTKTSNCPLLLIKAWGASELPSA